MAIGALDVVDRGVYGYVVNGELVYAGSSYKQLHELEHNHRNWQFRGYNPTAFRQNLITDDYSGGKFGWIYPPAPRTQQEVETLEGRVIRKHLPKFNQDLDPVGSSKRYGRY